MRLTSRMVMLVVFALAGGCSTSGNATTGEGDFISHVYGQSTGEDDDLSADTGYTADAGAAAPSEESTDSRSDSAERAIAEADIIQVDGDLLYALSEYTGLTVVNLADPANLQVVGTFRSSAIPFEMYLVDDVAYVMFNGFYTYDVDDDGNWSWQTTARMQALDVSDPTNIVLAGDAEVPGSISDSRMVGDVIYLVTSENGYCWHCDDTPRTRVASFSVGTFAKIDEVDFEDSYDWGPRSIAVTTERIYVAEGDGWARDTATGEITVVDIADPAGDLSIGAVITSAGPVTSRWQMSELAGTLRVISQPGGWGSVSPPVVETFTVNSSTDVAPLASLTVTLPANETLRSVQFDGTRAYAITQEVVVRSDPLFTFDLSDPANPVQVGELAIPGWVYHMVPHGDRIYALGYDEDDSSWERGMTVSIFDVSDLANPTMLDRVVFGGDWTQAAEDQDRIHKAFNILLDEGLIFVPFYGGEYDDEDCSYDYLSGIQIIDIAGDDLTLRGVAPQIGQARRALYHDGTLFGITDNAVQSFDITNRDDPSVLDTIDVARNISSVHVAGDGLLRFGNDWWTDRVVIDRVDFADASATATDNYLDLASTGLENEYTCGESGYWGSAVYTHGAIAYVPYYTSTYDYTGDDYTYERALTMFVVDTAPATPVIMGSFDVDPAVYTRVDRTYTNESYGQILVTDNALVIARNSYAYTYDADWDRTASTTGHAYDIYDLSDPSAPTYVSRYTVPASLATRNWGYGPWGCGIDYGWYWWYGSEATTLVSGDVIAASHAVGLDDGTGRVRYYLDRIDLSDPAHPALMPAVNIPGQPSYYDDDRGILVTLEDNLVSERAVDRSLGYEDCYVSGSRVTYDWERSVCRTWHRRLNTLRVGRTTAALVSRVDLDTAGLSDQVAVSDERIFVVRSSSSGGSSYYYDRDWEIATYALEGTGLLRAMPTVDLGLNGYWYSRLAARGSRAFVTHSNQLIEVDASGTGVTVENHDMPGWYCRSLQVHGDTAYCAMGSRGVLTIDL